jgi:HlyD family secretion protein
LRAKWFSTRTVCITQGSPTSSASSSPSFEKTGLLPGYSADVEVVLERREDTLRIPTAIIEGDGTVLVYDPATGRLERRTVRTGIANWEFTEVLEGVSAGERLVSSIDREGVEAGALVEPE